MSALTIEQLAERVEGMERRLALLEGAAIPRAPVPPPYPVPGAERTAPQYQPFSQKPPGREEEDAEYFLGAQVLPRVGAAVLVLGIGYLVSLAISRGLLGPWSLFGLAVVVCLGFIVVGQRKRDEREQFGELLTGTGVAGLYVTFAAGHAYQNLYSGEVLVAQFLGLSLVSLLYSLRRNSLAFLGIGVLGGFSAAAMPLRQDAFVVTSVLHAAVLGVATFVAARNRWSGALISVATAGFCVALGLAFGKAAGVPFGVGLIHLSALALVLGWSRIRPEEEGPIASSVCVAVCLFTAMGFAYGAYDRLVGTYHVLAACGGLGLVTAWRYSSSPARSFVWVALALSAVVYAPLGMPNVLSVLAYPALALGAALLARRLGIYAVGLGAVALSMGVVRYVVLLIWPDGSFWLEPTYLGLNTAAALTLGFASRHRDGEALGWVGAVATLSRLGYLGLIGPLRMPLNETITILLISVSLLFMALGFARKLSALRYLSFAGLAATVAKVMLVDLAMTDPVVRVAILMVLGLVLVGGGYAYIWQRRSQERTRSV
jgi:uncharacterized membrane protein